MFSFLLQILEIFLCKQVANGDVLIPDPLPAAEAGHPAPRSASDEEQVFR